MTPNPNTKVCLIVLDGWGLGKPDHTNAIHAAQTPFMHQLMKHYPNATLRTDGENVGLPEGQMGNSEVGHMNIGAGRVVYQELVRINRSIANRSFFSNAVLLEAFARAKSAKTKIHFIGLVSNGGVHSHMNHLLALCDMACEQNAENVFVHAITDGRDTDPMAGLKYIEQLEKHIADTHIKIASVCGRYYAMDRDKRWERVARAYHMLVNGKGLSFGSAAQAIDHAYAQHITDEFIEPSIIVGADGTPLAKVSDGDVVIVFNFRTDRCREITQVLTQQANHEYNMHPLGLHYITMTRYDESYRDVQVVFETDNLSQSLGEVLAQNGLSQLRIAETEKYPHVTFFFNGGREEPFEGESRIMVNSPKVATYDLQPEMSAPEVTARVVEAMKSNTPQFICLNFANPDMVGHTGVFSAIVKAVECTDQCLQQVVQCGLDLGYSFIITADHGNADRALNDDGTPNTAHTTNPVPVIVLSPGVAQVNAGILADLAPTVLQLLGLPQPQAMTGRSLIA